MCKLLWITMSSKVLYSSIFHIPTDQVPLLWQHSRSLRLSSTLKILNLQRLRTLLDHQDLGSFEYVTITLKHMKQFQTWRWFITLVVSCREEHKGRLYEDYSDEIVKFIILTAGYSNFFAAEPCRFSRVQTRLSTFSESIKSDTS